VPSFALPLWFVLMAAPGADSLPPPTVGTIPAAPRPGRVKPPKEPSAPADPSPPTERGGRASGRSRGRVTPPPEAQPAIDSTAENVIEDTTPRRRRPRQRTHVPEREEIPERKNVWGQERYAAVVPPALTLSSLQQEMGKGIRKTTETNASAGSERERLEQLAADIAKAREALRVETARLEALLKASGNCGGGGGIGMLMGDPLSGAPAVSAASLREAPNEQIDSVSKALKGMKPEQAAAVIARLDRGLAAEVLRRMRPADAGSVMGIIKPELAAELATEIALRKPTPNARAKKDGK
jgi:flagellar motility protein MotE (MotC chaperone)